MNSFLLLGIASYNTNMLQCFTQPMLLQGLFEDIPMCDIQHRSGVIPGDADGLLRNPLPSEEDWINARLHHDRSVTSVTAGLALLACLRAEAIEAAADQPEFGDTEKDGDPQVTKLDAANFAYCARSGD
jgi:hypothetical protein